MSGDGAWPGLDVPQSAHRSSALIGDPPWPAREDAVRKGFAYADRQARRPSVDAYTVLPVREAGGPCDVRCEREKLSKFRVHETTPD